MKVMFIFVMFPITFPLFPSFTEEENSDIPVLQVGKPVHL